MNLIHTITLQVGIIVELFLREWVIHGFLCPSTVNQWLQILAVCHTPSQKIKVTIIFTHKFYAAFVIYNVHDVVHLETVDGRSSSQQIVYVGYGTVRFRIP